MTLCPTEPLSLHDLQLMREERLGALDAPRDLIARHVLALVAAFAGERETYAQAVAGQVTCGGGESPALAAERQVRALAPDAESATLQLTGSHPHTGDVLCAVLGGEHLLEDYMRIKRVEQHDAFADPATAAEVAAAAARLEVGAREARERAERSRRWAREDQRLCSRCGESYGRHRRNRSREAWQPRDPGVCARFVDADTQSLGALAADLLPAAVRSWAARHELAVSATDVAEAAKLLGRMRTGNKGRATLAADAIATAAAVLDWMSR